LGFKKYNTNSFIDGLLILGIVFSPLTSLRIYKIGPAELLIFIWSIIIIFCSLRKKKEKSIFWGFWLRFMFLLFIGFLIAMLKDATNSGWILDSLTYLFFTSFIYALTIYCKNKGSNELIKILMKVFVISGIFYSFLYCYGTFINASFLGLDLWYGESRFTAGAMNPHQFAYLAGPMVFVGLFLIKNKKEGKVKTLLLIILIVLFLLMSLATQSSTLIAVFFLQACVFIYLSAVTDRNPKIRILKILIFTCILAIFMVTFYERINNEFWSWVSSDENGLGRFELLAYAIESFNISPIFGLGPGGHVWTYDGIMESHNTYMELLLNSGILGLLNYLILVISILAIIKKDKYAVLIVTFFVFYGFGGYALRRPMLWFLVIFIVYIFLNKKNKKEYLMLNK